MNSHLHVAITDEELSEWADKRADDAGRLARELIASRNGQKVPQDVTKLVIAARVVAFEDQSREAIRALDIASEAFADRVPWDGEPALSPPAVPGEVERENAKLVELIKTRFLGVHPDELDCYLEYDDWTRIIAALSVPLPEIEGGDKGDGWQKAVGWFFRNNAGDPWQFSTAEPEICYEKHRAYSDAQPIPEAVRYAERLAASLWEKHWKDDAPQWEPLSGDLIGILTQIDNMTAGLTRKGDGWQTIETAPKDKTAVIIAVPTEDLEDFIVGEAYFDPENYDVGDWWWAGTSCGDYHAGPVSEMNYNGPTHWRPLPAAPSASIEGETP